MKFAYQIRKQIWIWYDILWAQSFTVLIAYLYWDITTHSYTKSPHSHTYLRPFFGCGWSLIMKTIVKEIYFFQSYKLEPKMGEGKCVVVVTHTPKKSRAGVNNTQKPSVWLFATSLSAIMEHFLERIALIVRHWYKSTQIRKKTNINLLS